MVSLSQLQVTEMIRLRSVEHLTRLQIAEHMGVTTYQVKKAWGKLPERLRGHLPESHLKAAVTARRTWATRSRMEPVSEDQCVKCGMFFDEMNLRLGGQGCLWCKLQDMGIVIVHLPSLVG